MKNFILEIVPDEIKFLQYVAYDTKSSTLTYKYFKTCSPIDLPKAVHNNFFFINNTACY